MCYNTGRCDSSTGTSHGEDLLFLLNETNVLDDGLKFNGVMKPIIFVFVDGGPDENPQHDKVRDTHIYTFEFFWQLHA